MELVMQLATLPGIKLMRTHAIIRRFVARIHTGSAARSLLGLVIFRKLSDRHFSMAVYALLIVSGAGLIAK